MFKQGKRYAFNKEVYVRDLETNKELYEIVLGNSIEEEKEKLWVNMCEGKEVTVLNEDDAKIVADGATYLISEDWCVMIND